GIEIAFWDSTNVETGVEQQRRYAVNGERFPSVSSILRTLGPKDAIAPWAVKQRDEGRDWREESRLAAERGTAAHDLLLRAMLSERTSLADLPDEFRAWGQAAYRWLRARRPHVIAAE